MKTYYQNVINCFDNKLLKLDGQKNKLGILSNPNTDFTRNRKLDFINMMKSIVFSSGKPIREELYDYFDYDINTATSSAFVQQRDKLKPESFEFLFKSLNKSYPCFKKYKGYRLIAVDGSDLHISYDENDHSTFVHSDTHTGYNLIHINSAYDILNHRYVDTIIKGYFHTGEQYSMYTMAERFDDKAIFIADRNYSTWNNMEHIIHSKQMFIIRVQDIHSRTSNLRLFNLPDSEFDLDVETTLTKVQSKITKDSSKYRILSNNSTFDFIDKNNPYYPVKYRAVRFRIEGQEEYESIITNLDRNLFSASDIKKLYNMRWSIETSFRHLKYSTNLSALHCRKRNSIKQEIWARLILYNLSMIMIEQAIKSISVKNGKYSYYCNFSRAVHIIRNLAKRKGGIPPGLEKLLLNELLPFRPNRLDLRKVGKQDFVCFNYRFS